MTKKMFCLKEAQRSHTDSSLQPHSSSQSPSQILKNFKLAKDSDQRFDPTLKKYPKRHERPKTKLSFADVRSEEMETRSKGRT